MTNCGHFVISLDLELYWGVHDSNSLAAYGENIKNVHQVIPELLSLFAKYNVKATFATVGFLFLSNKDEMKQHFPKKLPQYHNRQLSTYQHFDSIGNSYADDPYHFGEHLVDIILAAPGHEMATHTFSHYYCLQKGQSPEEFSQDLEMAATVARQKNVEIRSLVFPRNQYNEEYLEVCRQHGIAAIRGNQPVWFYKTKSYEEESRLKRAFKLADSYINIAGPHTYRPQIKNGVVDIPASSFLRPYHKRLAFLDPMKIIRIKNSMTHAAKNKRVFHLWWHPHNFGRDMKKNLELLEKILQHYAYLHHTFRYQSATMYEVAQKTITANAI